MLIDPKKLPPAKIRLGSRYKKIPYQHFSILTIEEPSKRATALCRRCEHRCESPRVYVSFGRMKPYMWHSNYGHKRDNIAFFCFNCFFHDERTIEWLNTGVWKDLEYRGSRYVGEKKAGGPDWTLDEFLTSEILTHRLIAQFILECQEEMQRVEAVTART